LVKKGDPIAELDPRDYQVAVENAQAALASAQANAAAAHVNVPITTINTGSNLRSADADVSGASATVAQAARQLEAAHARVAEAQANAVKAQADLDRNKPLVEKDVISKQQFDAAVASADATKAALADALATEQAASDGVRVAKRSGHPGSGRAKICPDRPAAGGCAECARQAGRGPGSTSASPARSANLNLSYTKIIAPADGIITRKSVEVDQNVSAGQNLLTLVSLEDLWITANFKETQLRHMLAGQKVAVHVDSTGKDYSGKVSQIGGATGSSSRSSRLKNATGTT